ncbi:polysaccharide pyruvyl transferase family protein [Bacillus sp. AK128]
MKIGIIGNYGHDNNGDEAILSGLLNQLTHQLSIPKEDIMIFSNNPENTRSRHHIKAVQLLHKKGSMMKSIIATLSYHYPTLKELDVLIIGGGGLLMDMYKRDAPLYSTLGVMGHYAGCKVVIYGVGAGPITTKAGRFFIKQLTKVSDYVTVRDEPSKTLLKEIGVSKQISVIGDPAFSLESPPYRDLSSTISKIGVTAVPYFSHAYWPEANPTKYQNYIKGMAKSLDDVINKHHVNITFFSTKYPQDVEVTRDIYGEMENKQEVIIIEDNLHPNELVSLCAKQDLIIGTRLHSLILAVVAKTPIIGVGYHQKVHDFMDTISKLDQYIKIDDFINQKLNLSDMVETMKQDWLQHQTEAEQICSKMKSETEKGVRTLQMIGERK